MIDHSSSDDAHSGSGSGSGSGPRSDAGARRRDTRAWCALVCVPFAVSTALTTVFVLARAVVGDGLDGLVRDGAVAVFAIALIVSVVALTVHEIRR